MRGQCYHLYAPFGLKNEPKLETLGEHGGVFWDIHFNYTETSLHL